MNKNQKQSITGKASYKSPVSRQFKSPLSRSNAKVQPESTSELKEQVNALKKKLEKTELEIRELEAAGYKESELQTHIDKLHEYNEIKDVGQMLLGRIAELEGVQTKDLYPKYGLDLND